MTDRLLKVRTGRHPHELLIVGVTILLGIAGMISPERISGAVAAQFPWPWAMLLWASMAVFAGVTLFGILLPRIEGLLIERVGLLVLALLFSAYVAAVLLRVGTSGLVAVSMPTALVVANVVRAVQIRSDLAFLRSYLTDHPGEKVR